MKNFRTATILLLLASAFGYFVDVYDLLIFSVIRNASLTSLGISPHDSLQVGLGLLNWQMAVLLIGGLLCGSLADRRGRLTALFGSIALYSAANLLNARVNTLNEYALLRFLAGVGLAGQFGADAGVSRRAEGALRGKARGTMHIPAIALEPKVGNWIRREESCPRRSLASG